MAKILQKFMAADGVDDTNVRLRNNHALRARNALDSADVDVLKLNTDDAPEFPAIPILPAADPTTERQAAHKGYVDDMIAVVEQDLSDVVELFNDALADWAHETPTGTVNGSNTGFTISHAPIAANALIVFVNGLLQFPTTHYTLSGTTITFVTAPVTGSDIRAVFLKGA